MASFCADLPALPPTPAGTRSKRRLSSHAASPDPYDYDDGDDSVIDDDSAQHGKRSKRSRGANAATSGSPNRAAIGGAAAGQPQRALSDKEKEQRRVARMIRNRNAAQASRDRKKEHAAFLERRVAELEHLLRQAGHKVPAPSAPSYFASTVQPYSQQVRAPPRSQRATSVADEDQTGRAADLEDENDALRSQLHLEQQESAQLRARLEIAEDELDRLAPLAALTADAPFSPFSGTSTPLPGFEPTFAFDTPNLSPLPQPEERAYLEERERQRRLATRHASTDLATAHDDDPQHAGEKQGTDSSRLVAREDDTSLPRKLSSTAPSLAGDDIASTPPATESYLELDDVTISPVWSDWVEGVSAASAANKCSAEQQAVIDTVGDESALAFLDLSFLQDGPVTATC